MRKIIELLKYVAVLVALLACCVNWGDLIGC